MLRVNNLLGFGKKPHVIGGGGGFDTDAQAFFTATGISDSTIQNAIDALVIGLKADGIWTKCIAIYPFVGGDATKHSYNLKNTAAFQIAWNGTITHDANGVTGGGGVSDFGNTGITPSTHLTLNDTHLSAYCRTSAASSNPDMGCIATDRLNLSVRIGSNAITEHGSNFIVSANADGQGFYVTSRRSNTDLELYKNGSSMATNTGSGGGSLPNTTIRVCNSNGQGGSNHNLAFATIGAGLTDTEVGNFNTRVETFQDALSRGVV